MTGFNIGYILSFSFFRHKKPCLCKFSSKRFPSDLSHDSSGRSLKCCWNDRDPSPAPCRVCCPVVRVLSFWVSLCEEGCGQPGTSEGAGVVRAPSVWCGAEGVPVEGMWGRKEPGANLLQEERPWETRVQRWLSPPRGGDRPGAPAPRPGLRTVCSLGPRHWARTQYVSLTGTESEEKLLM